MTQHVKTLRTHSQKKMKQVHEQQEQQVHEQQVHEQQEQQQVHEQQEQQEQQEQSQIDTRVSYTNCGYCKCKGHNIRQCTSEKIPELMVELERIVNPQTHQTHHQVHIHQTQEEKEENLYGWLKTKKMEDVRVIAMKYDIPLWMNKHEMMLHVVEYRFAGYISRKYQRRSTINRIMYLQMRLLRNDLRLDDLHRLTMDQLTSLNNMYTNEEALMVAQIADEQRARSSRKFKIERINLRENELATFERANESTNDDYDHDGGATRKIGTIMVIHRSTHNVRISRRDTSLDTEKETEYCSICLEENKDIMECVKINCNHVFCGDCLESHIRSTSTSTSASAIANTNISPLCPLCRAETKIMLVYGDEMNDKFNHVVA